jgi:hypothetical protein
MADIFEDPRLIWCMNNRHELIKHSNEFAAVTKEGALAYAPTIAKLREIIHREEINIRSILIIDVNMWTDDWGHG